MGVTCVPLTSHGTNPAAAAGSHGTHPVLTAAVECWEAETGLQSVKEDQWTWC